MIEEDEVCCTCGGKGYLLNQTYGYADIPDGWVPVQACDSCQALDGDEAAAVEAGKDRGSNSFRWFPGVDDEPGDYAVIE